MSKHHDPIASYLNHHGRAGSFGEFTLDDIVRHVRDHRRGHRHDGRTRGRRDSRPS